MFQKILIANRGEIACRVIKTARKMGIQTVAVYSEADADALHVRMADEAVLIGPPAASESYLVADKIIQAAKETGAQAIHPGYGFLSENAGFAERLESEGIAFIGPNVKAIQVMGDKIESKKFANDAKVNTVPGYLGVIQTPEEAIKIAGDIGYPVMIKASAGGGGKGMRIAWSEDEVAEGFISSMNEARSSFGDDRVFIEKFITEPRHIEIQVLADKHGNVVYVGERECSVQRRNQKVIEEAPSPFIDDATRKQMGEQAVALAKAVDYESAGTVEFIVDGARNFYFLEMNTRLQVEHPVTELVSGIDLVEQMIRVAAGEKLELAQADIKLNGWAIESRIYAEDPYRNFLPSIGRLVRYRPPEESCEGGLTIRNDTGVEEGSEISLFYDPMIAKLCTHGPDRIAAIDHMMLALDSFWIDGIEQNIPFLSAVYGQERFREGRLTTGYIDEEFPDGFEGAAVSEETHFKLAAVAVFAEARLGQRNRAHLDVDLSEDLSAPVHRVVIGGERSLDVTFAAEGDGLRVCSLDGGPKDFTLFSDWHLGESLIRIRINDELMAVRVERQLDGWDLSYRGATLVLAVHRPEVAELAKLMPERIVPDTSNLLLCPMPGLVISIEVEEGQQIKAGSPVAVVEAMKMENILRAERDCVVKKIHAVPGDSLAVDEIIVEYELAD
ncbi:MAG: acetyl/propionyl/methylcrotonyl-CoA carboxylase subunit alpha [Alphaproteobacteria bacterium]|nr:MAG: acetyl/propionyl/methylcrotonyl-CoA carboxylase subunit alpha [Alphaproteobacteria bacterium]